jgi:hypothetical protein
MVFAAGLPPHDHHRAKLCLRGDGWLSWYPFELTPFVKTMHFVVSESYRSREAASDRSR